MKESEVRKLVSEYLQIQYPAIIYRWDIAADLKLTPGQAARHKHLHPLRGYPDLFIAAARHGHHGLYIELKKDGVRIWTKDGRYASEHLKEQGEVIGRLREEGYEADFARGFDEAKEMIDNYLRR